MIIELTERFQEVVKDNDKLYEKLAEAQAELLEIFDSLNATIEAQRETLADFGMV